MKKLIAFLGVIIVSFVISGCVKIDNEKKIDESKMDSALIQDIMRNAPKNFEKKVIDLEKYVVSYSKKIESFEMTGSLRKEDLDLAVSPDKQKIADPNIYLTKYYKNGKLVVESDVDELFAVNFVAEKKILSLEQCGTPCSFDQAFWLDNNRVVLVGTREADPQNFYLDFLNIYNFSTNMVTSYQSESYSREQK